MQRRQPSRARKPTSRLPRIWLITDKRNDDVLEAAIRRLPRGSGIIYRHKHLSKVERRRRFAKVQQSARRKGMAVILASGPRRARKWGADGIWRPASEPHFGLVRPALSVMAVHNMREMRLANARGVDAITLSPVFPTRTHIGAPALGRVKFLLLARYSRHPVIALGGMTARRSRGPAFRRIFGWAAIDGLSLYDDIWPAK